MACVGGEGVGPGDNFCTVLDGVYEQTLLVFETPGLETYIGNNAGYVIEVDEQLTNTHPASYNSAWISLPIINQTDFAKTYTVVCDSASGAVLELYDKLAVSDNNTLLNLALSGANKNVTGQGTNTITFTLDDLTNPLNLVNVGILRVFNPTDGGGAFTLTASEVEPLPGPVITETAQFNSLSSASIITAANKIQETIKLVTSELSLFMTLKEKITDTAYFQNLIYILAEELIAETAGYSDDVSKIHFKIEKIVNKLGFHSSSNSSAELIEEIATVLTLIDVINGAFLLNISETTAFGDAIDTKIQAYIAIINELLFTNEISEQRHIQFFIADGITITSTTNDLTVFQSIIKEGLALFGSVNFDGTEYLAYTYNTQSSGITEYSNYHFNSFSWPLAAASDGIYELTGNSDDGTPIQASIKTGLMDFGTSLKKQVPYVYLGIAASGRVLLKVTTTDRGIRKEVWYEVNSSNLSIDTVRKQLGRGLEAKYWQFELSNIEGEDFSLESMELLPLVLKRRV